MVVSERADRVHVVSAAGIFFIITAADVLAAERAAPLLSGEDLLGVGTTGITQGVTSGAPGSILYPDQILTVDVEDALPPGTQADARVQAWSKAYRFIVVPLTLAIHADPKTPPKSVVINAAFRNTGQAAKQPIIIDIFPATGFKAEPLQGTATAAIGVGADLKFGDKLPVNANASVKGALSYTYNRAFANVQSGYASSASFWQFAATQDQQPIGALPLKLTIGVPRTAAQNSLSLAIDVVAKFGSAWWGDEVRASFLSEVMLPQK